MKEMMNNLDFIKIKKKQTFTQKETTSREGGQATHREK